jgi:hypothetical protein
MDPQPPKWLNPSLPDELNQLILDLLNKTPDRRPNDAEVMQRLQSISFEDNAQNPAVSVSSFNHSKSSIGRAGRGALVGRTAELTQIKGWIESAINGQCQLGLISGPSGIGKSRLVEEALIYARLRGIKVFNTRAYREDSALSFQPIINSLRPISADVTAVDSAVQRLFNGETDDVESMSESMRRRINEGIIQYFKALATDTPLMFFMDDIHRADTASLNLILQLARSTTESRLLLIGTYSDDGPIPTGLNEIILAQKQDRLGVRISLVPFSRRETNEQLQTLFGSSVSDSFVERVYSETEGNPLYVEEIARWLVDEGIATRQGTHWSIEGTEHWQLPPHLQDFMQGLVERRIRRIMRDHVMRKGGLDFATCIYRGKVHHEVFEEQLRRQLSHLATRRSVKEQVERYLRIADDIHIFVDSVNERLSELKQGDLFRVVLDVTQGGVMYYYLGEDSYIVGATTDQSAMDDNTADLEMRSMVAEIQDLLSKAGT